MRSKYAVSGAMLIALGVLIFLKIIGWIAFSIFELWPIVLIWLGLEFERHGLSSPPKHAGELVPGGILLSYGALFMLCSLFGWGLMSKLWPVFILGVAFGLFQLYIVTPERGLLISVIAVGAPGLFFLLGSWLDFRIAIALLLIGAGVLIMHSQRHGDNK